MVAEVVIAAGIAGLIAYLSHQQTKEAARAAALSKALHEHHERWARDNELWAEKVGQLRVELEAERQRTTMAEYGRTVKGG